MTEQQGSVRRAGPEDVPALVALMTDFYAEAGFALPVAPATRTFETLLAQPDRGAIWLMELAGRPAGYVVLTVSFSMEFGGLRGFVDDLFVRPDCRCRGLATSALDAVRRACETDGIRALLVETSLSTEPAMRVYRRFGFTETGRLLLTMPLAAALHEPSA